MTAADLCVQDLSWMGRRGGDILLHKTSFELGAGRVLGVVGPNGAGKTTLLRLLYRFLRPATGRVCIDGEDIWALPARRVAQRIAAVLQEKSSDFALTVEEVVALGRTPHRRRFGGAGDSDDREIVGRALSRMGLDRLANRHLGRVSGGERQRVMVARALAQEPRILILDEPTNYLDIRHQLEVLALIRDLPFTIITSLHDLNLAARVCDDVLLLHTGRTVAFGPPAAVLTEAAVARAFQVVACRERLSPSQAEHLTFHLQDKGLQP